MNDDDFDDDDFWDDEDEPSEYLSETDDEMSDKPTNPKNYVVSYRLNRLRSIPSDIEDLANEIGQTVAGMEEQALAQDKVIDDLKAQIVQLQKPFGEKMPYRAIRLIDSPVHFSDTDPDDLFQTRWNNYQQQYDDARAIAESNNVALAHNTRLFQQIIDLLKGIGYATHTQKMVRRKPVIVETEWYAALMKVAPSCDWTTAKLDQHYVTSKARRDDCVDRRKKIKEAAEEQAKLQRQAAELARLQNLLSEQTKRVDAMKVLARSVGLNPDQMTAEELEQRLNTELKKREAGDGLHRAINLADHAADDAVDHVPEKSFQKV